MFHKDGFEASVRLSFVSVFDEYEKTAELSIEDSIKNELSGDFERLMLAVGKKRRNHKQVRQECKLLNQRVFFSLHAQFSA